MSSNNSKNKLKGQILYCLTHYPQTRNSDVELTIQVWREFYPSRIMKGSKTGKEAVLLTDLFELPREDNVKRIRAKIQNELGKFLPTSLEVALQRGIEEGKWRSYMARMDEFRRI